MSSLEIDKIDNMDNKERIISKQCISMFYENMT